MLYALRGSGPGQNRAFKDAVAHVVSVPGDDHSIEFQNPLLEAEQLSAQCGKTCTHDIGHSFVVSVGNNAQQFLYAFTSNRCHDAKFGKMRSDRIDHSRLLAAEQMPRTM